MVMNFQLQLDLFVFQALRNDAYDHYTAMYYLLLERLKLHRSSFSAMDGKGDSRRRRPSTIAEQAMLRTTGAQGRPVLANIKQGMFSRTTDCVSPPVHTTCMSPGQQQNTFTTDNDNRNMAGNDFVVTNLCSKPPPSTTGYTAPTGVITTSIDEGVELDYERDSDSVQSSTSLCSNMSHESNSQRCRSGSTESPPTRGVPVLGEGSMPLGVMRGNMFRDLSHMTTIDLSNQSISTGAGSPFTSFDSNIEADLMSSLTSCSTQPSSPSVGPLTSPLAGPVAPHHSNDGPTNISMTPPVSSKFNHSYKMSCYRAGRCNPQEQSTDDAVDDGRDTGSPVSFREGRRASDGLMAQGVIAFRQRLKDSMKTRGIPELKKEMENLAILYQSSVTEDEVKYLQQQHSQYQENNQGRQWSLDEGAPPELHPQLVTKRKSLPTPAQLELTPHKFQAILKNINAGRVLDPDNLSRLAACPSAEVSAGSLGVVSGGYGLRSCEFQTPGGKPLQQQLLQHRLQQKRQVFQRHPHPPMSLQQQFQQLNLDPQQPAVRYPTHAIPEQQYDDTLPGGTSMTPTPDAGNGTCPEPLAEVSAPCRPHAESHSLPTEGTDGDCGNATGSGSAGEEDTGSIPLAGRNLDQQGDLPRQPITTNLPPLSLFAYQQQPSQTGPIYSLKQIQGQPLASFMRNRHIIRQTSYKLAQQQPVVMPTAYGEEGMLTWQHPTCEAPQLSPTFEESNENEEEAEAVGGHGNSQGDPGGSEQTNMDFS